MALIRRDGFHLTAGHSVVSVSDATRFHPRLGARPLRDTIKKHLRGAVATNAMVGEVRSRTLGIRCVRKSISRAAFLSNAMAPRPKLFRLGCCLPQPAP